MVVEISTFTQSSVNKNKLDSTLKVNVTDIQTDNGEY